MSIQQNHFSMSQSSNGIKLNEVIRVAMDVQDAFQPTDDATFLLFPFAAGNRLIDGSPCLVTNSGWPASFTSSTMARH